MQRSAGSARALLVMVLVACVVVGAGSLLVLSSDPPGDGPEGSIAGGGTTRPLAPVPGGQRERGAERDSDLDDPDDDDDGIVDFSDRSPEGPSFHVTPESLTRAVDAWHREEMMRMVGVLQDSGEAVPQEIVDRLLAALARSDLALDAQAVLGRVTDDVTVGKLAQLASDPSASLDARRHALAALATSGPASARTQLMALVASGETDARVRRAALPALAATGGVEAAQTLADLLLDEDVRESGLRGPLLAALAQTEDAGVVLAQLMDRAREGRDVDVASLVLVTAQQQGENADATVRGLVRDVLLDGRAGGLAPEDEEASVLKLRAEALAAAASMGGDLLPEVVRLALQGDGMLSHSAAHALRNARGEDAAEAIAGAVDRVQDPRIRYQLVEALGETGSRKATPQLTRLLNDEEDNVRRAAARALVQLRDPRAIDAVLERLEGGENDYQMSNTLVKALGRMGARKALDRLNEMWDRAEAGEPEMKSLEPFVRNAIKRIETGNPDSELLAERE